MAWQAYDVRSDRADADHRLADRRHGALRVRRHGDGGGRTSRRFGGGRGAPPVQGNPGHHAGHRQAPVRHRGRHADARGDQGNDDPVAAAGAGADPGRPDPRAAGARRRADGHHRHRAVRRHLDVHRRWRLGQRQEIHRGRPLRRQRLRCPQGGGHRRYGRRSLQGHRRPGGQPADQDHQHRRAAHRAADGVGRMRLGYAIKAALAAFFVGSVAGPAQARDAVVAQRYMVAAAHPLAVEAGYGVLKRGGSALDAAIAVQAVLGLVEPESSGIGGGAFLLHWSEAGKKLRSYDGRETAPAAARPDRFLKNSQPMEFHEAAVGGRSVGVPGVLRMLELAHRRHGRLAWRELFADAIRLAEEGFPVSPRLRALLSEERFLRDDLEARKVYYSGGESIFNPEYAKTLRIIAEKGADAFYRGPIAADMVRAVRANARPGDLTEADLAAYRALEREPLCGPYRGWRVCSMGPPSSGGVAVLQILGLLERSAFAAAPPRSAAAVHYFSEAGRLAYADRAR